MGTTPLPLKLLVLDLPLTPELEALREQGHRIVTDDYGDVRDYDLILGPRCWRLIPEHMEFLGLALKEARAYARATRPKVKKGSKSGATKA